MQNLKGYTNCIKWTHSEEYTSDLQLKVNFKIFDFYTSIM
jgi:hypothetical protein